MLPELSDAAMIHGVTSAYQSPRLRLDSSGRVPVAA
jgi:hypothetical protein